MMVVLWYFLHTIICCLLLSSFCLCIQQSLFPHHFLVHRFFLFAFVKYPISSQPIPCFSVTDFSSFILHAIISTPYLNNLIAHVLIVSILFGTFSLEIIISLRLRPLLHLKSCNRLFFHQFIHSENTQVIISRLFNLINNRPQ